MQSDFVVDVMQTNLLSSAHERTIAQTVDYSEREFRCEQGGSPGIVL